MPPTNEQVLAALALYPRGLLLKHLVQVLSPASRNEVLKAVQNLIPLQVLPPIQRVSNCWRLKNPPQFLSSDPLNLIPVWQWEHALFLHEIGPCQTSEFTDRSPSYLTPDAIRSRLKTLLIQGLIGRKESGEYYCPECVAELAKRHLQTPCLSQ